MQMLEVGKKYLICTLTRYYVGEVVECSPIKTLLKNASWIPDTGRFNECLKNGTFTEVEPFPDEVIINTMMVVDAAEWDHPLPRKAK